MSSIVCLPTRPKRGSSVGIVDVGRLAFQDAARAELGEVGRVLRIVGQLRLFLGVEVVEVAEELIEAVHGRQRGVAIADVVLAELAGDIAEVLEQAADRGIELAHAHRRTGEADLAQSASHDVLAGEERRAAGRAGLLAVVVLEFDAFLGDAVDVRGLVAHQAIGVGADVGDADVVAPDDEDVRLAAAGRRCGGRRRLRILCLRRCCSRRGKCEQRAAAQKNVSAVEREIGLRIRLGVSLSLRHQILLVYVIDLLSPVAACSQCPRTSGLGRRIRSRPSSLRVAWFAMTGGPCEPPVIGHPITWPLPPEQPRFSPSPRRG